MEPCPQIPFAVEPVLDSFLQSFTILTVGDMSSLRLGARVLVMVGACESQGSRDQRLCTAAAGGPVWLSVVSMSRLPRGEGRGRAAGASLGDR